MADKCNVLWEKHRMYLPDARKKAVHRCKPCKFFMTIQGRVEERYGCVVDIKAYGNLEKRIPTVIPVMEISSGSAWRAWILCTNAVTRKHKAAGDLN